MTEDIYKAAAEAIQTVLNDTEYDNNVSDEDWETIRKAKRVINRLIQKNERR